MVRQTPPRMPDLQTLIRNVVTDIVTGENSRTATRENNNLQSSSSGDHGNVTQELNAIFGVSRQIYNPRQNDGRSPTPRRKSRQTVQTCLTKSNQRAAKTVTNSGFYMKNVFLLPSTSWTVVPRRNTMNYLQSHGLVVDAYEIDNKWNEEELITSFNDLFKEILEKENQSFVK